MAMQPAKYEKLKKSIFNFIWNELDPLEEQISRTGTFSKEDLFPKFRNQGLFGLMVPEEYGGSGLSVTQYIPILAELSKIQGGIRVVIHGHNTTAKCMTTGREEQKRAFLPKIATGELSVAFGMTEPDAGTGTDIKTTAVCDGGDYVINGNKHLITNADFAQLSLIFCYTDRALGANGISAILVEKDTPGFTIGDMPHFMGCWGSYHCRLTLKDCRVPAANVLGEEGKGLTQALNGLEISRLFIAATSLGTAERSLELAIQHAKRRVTFGRPIADRQAVQGYLADMAMDIYAMKTMIYDTARKYDEGKPVIFETSACKLFASEAVCRVTDKALLVFGGIGYTQQYPIERLYRDARLNLLEEGTPTIQRLVMARFLLQR